jgi:hypothetical protein
VYSLHINISTVQKGLYLETATGMQTCIPKSEFPTIYKLKINVNFIMKQVFNEVYFKSIDYWSPTISVKGQQPSLPAGEQVASVKVAVSGIAILKHCAVFTIHSYKLHVWPLVT